MLAITYQSPMYLGKSTWETVRKSFFIDDHPASIATKISTTVTNRLRPLIAAPTRLYRTDSEPPATRFLARSRTAPHMPSKTCASVETRGSRGARHRFGLKAPESAADGHPGSSTNRWRCACNVTLQPTIGARASSAVETTTGYPQPA